MSRKPFFLIVIFSVFSGLIIAQKQIPEVFAKLHYDKEGNLYHQYKGEKLYAKKYTSFLSLENLKGNPVGVEEGVLLNFGSSDFSGKLHFGLIHYSDSKHPMPVWLGRTVDIKNGKVIVPIKERLSGNHDMTGWRKAGIGTLGYRVANHEGRLLYDGIITFTYDKKKGFDIATTLIEGPFVNMLTSAGATISFITNKAIKAKITIDGKVFEEGVATKNHEITINGLSAATVHHYEVDYVDFKQNYHFTTAPEKGSRKPFVFAYISDSRAGKGGGEHDLYGANMYVMRKISALATFKNAAFMQVTGDLINGYSTSKGNINLQYANWRRSIEPYAHYFPVIAGFGNHEAYGKLFTGKKGKWKAFITGFPFETESGSAVFAQNFVNPSNGPLSEDGAEYDPNPNKIDFPPYDETVFYYTYDNVAMIVLNSNYFFSPKIKNNPSTGGNLHGYLMDMQIKWLEKTLEMFEKDATIDHVFVSQHTPAFPNGGHVGDDMWYGGNNKPRPTIAGKKVKKGIIERRDDYLNLVINKSSKVVAMLTGDEHNYNKVEITPEVNIYPKNYTYKKLERSRTIWQINNGAAGAPYYARDKNTPWQAAVSGFTTQQALVLIYVDGGKVWVEVMNPDTLEMVDEYVLRP